MLHDLFVVPNVVFMIPIVAILGGLATGMVKMLIDASEKRLELRIRLKEAGAVRVDDSGTKTLREEFVAFKDTSTQYDLSLDHTLRSIEDRLARLEAKVSAPVRPAQAVSEEERQQVVGRSE